MAAIFLTFKQHKTQGCIDTKMGAKENAKH